MIQTIDAHNVENDTIEMNSSGTTQPITSRPTQRDMKPKTSVMAVIFLVAILSGLGTGYGIHLLNNKGGSLIGGEETEAGAVKEQTPTSGIKVGDVYGSSNESIFKDSAEGIIQAGGIEGEGTHKLVRSGGVSQTVYLTSSVTDLDKFIGMKVKVWGETNTAQKAGWLMDVGRVKVIELDAEIPEESKPTITSTPKAGAKSSTKKAPADEESGD